MKAVMIEEGGVINVHDQPKPTIQKPDDVLIKVAYSGLCGSDIPRIFANGAHFYPVTLGHEFSGEVVECGEQVKDLSAGDAIACVPLLPCFECDECKRHYYSLCKKYSFVGSRSHGGNAEYIVMKRANIFKLPEGVSLLEGAFFEPITVGLHALLLAGKCENKHVVIIGAGTIGLLAMQCAKAMGAASISVIDINPRKLELARELGADFCFNSAELKVDEIQSAMAAIRFNQLVLETAGTPQTVNLSINIAGPRAQVSLVGTLHHDLHMTQATFSQILRKELTLMGSWMNYSETWPGEEWQIAAEIFRNKQMKLDKLTASINSPDEYAQQLRELNGKAMNGKIILKF